MPKLCHTKPCKHCPWSKNSAKGWLGDDSPMGFLQSTLAEAPMPCHAAVDYTDPEWQANQMTDAPLCAGALVFLRNTGKMPRDPEHAAAMQQVEDPDGVVFEHPQQFLDHHRAGPCKPEGPHDHLPPHLRPAEASKCACGQPATTKLEDDASTPACAKCADRFCWGCKTVASTEAWACCGDLKCKCDNGCACGEEWAS